MHPWASWRRAGLAGLLASLAVAAAAQPAASELLFCAEDENSYPWLLRDGSGLNPLMVQRVGQRVGWTIRIELLPWRRCLQSLQENRVDGAFKASFKPERLKIGAYPMRGGQPDASRAMLDESYHLYRLKGSAVSWDGQQVSQLEGPVGAQAGFSVVELLKRLNLATESGAKAPDVLLTMLQRGRLGAVALQTSQGDFELGRRPQLAASIERVGPPLLSQPYYLLLSHALVQRDPALAERIWDAVAAVRESAEYRAALQSARAAAASR